VCCVLCRLGLSQSAFFCSRIRDVSVSYHIFTSLIAYLFEFYIYSLLFTHIYSKKYPSIVDMLPHHHITYKDISVLT
jgi:hypothetical protein